MRKDCCLILDTVKKNDGRGRDAKGLRAVDGTRRTRMDYLAPGRTPAIVKNCLDALFGRAHLSRQHSLQLTQDAVGFTRPKFRDLIRAAISCMTISGRRRASA